MPETARTDSLASAAIAERTIVQERVFDAPRALVWLAWNDPKHVDAWWGPNGFRNETKSKELRVGGEWRFVMHGPDGKDWDNCIRYEEVVENERLVYAHGAGGSDEPHFHVTVTFRDVGAKTKVTMTSLFPSAEAVAAVKKFGAVAGGQQTLARLAGYLPHLADGSANDAMVVTRLLDAPVALVWDAWAKPELLVRWRGPKNFTTPIAEIDFRVGGAYRIVMRAPDGADHPFHGHYREIVPGARIVFDAVMAHLDGEKVVTTVTFEDDDGKTLLTVRQDRPRNAEAAAGQRESWSGSLETLDAMLAAARA